MPPWERYAAPQQQPAAGPWTRYAPPPEAAAEPQEESGRESSYGGAGTAWLEHFIGDIPVVGPALQTGSDYLGTEVMGRLSGQDPSKMREDIWARRERRTEDYPASSMSGGVAGNLAAFGGAGSTAAGARALGLTGKNLGARALTSGVTNATISAADASARSGNPTDIATAGGIGGAIGTAIPIVGAGINALGRAAKDTVGPRINALFRPTAEAERRVGTAVGIDRANAPTLGAADEASAKLNQQSVLNVDRGGETTRALARSAANTDPEARALIEKTASDRFSGQGERARSFIDRITGGAVDDVTAQERLKSAARAANKPAYDRAMQSPAALDMWDDEFAELTTSPAVRAAVRRATTTGADRAVAEGVVPIRNPFKEVKGKIELSAPDDPSARPTLEFWNAVKIQLDDQIGIAQRAGAKGRASDLIGLKKRLVAKLDAAVPEYKSARAGAAAFFDAEDALDAGKKFVTQNRKNLDVAAALKQMAPAERTTFAVGFAGQLKEQIKQSGDRTNVINKLFGSEQSREKIRMALGPKAFGEFEQFVKVENTMDMLRSAMGNSTTSRQLVELGLAGSAGVGTGLYTGDWKTGLAAGLVAAAGRRYSGAQNVKITKRVAELLLSDDPQDIQRLVTLASQNKQAARAVTLMQDIVARSTANLSLTGGQAGEPSAE
jgi:hypothetical protein